MTDKLHTENCENCLLREVCNNGASITDELIDTVIERGSDHEKYMLDKILSILFEIIDDVAGIVSNDGEDLIVKVFQPKVPWRNYKLN